MTEVSLVPFLYKAKFDGLFDKIVSTLVTLGSHFLFIMIQLLFSTDQASLIKFR